MTEDAKRLQRFLKEQNQSDLAAKQGEIVEHMQRRGLPERMEQQVSSVVLPSEADEGQTLEELLALNQEIIAFFVKNYPKGGPHVDPLEVAAKFNEEIGRFVSDRTPMQYLLLPLHSGYSIQTHLSKEAKESANLISPAVRGRYNESVFGVFRAAKDKTVTSLRLSQQELEGLNNVGPQKASYAVVAFKK